MSYCPEEQTGGRVLKDRRLSQAAPVARASSVPATIGESFRSFFDAVDEFFSNLASVRLGPLLLALRLLRGLPDLPRARELQHPARRLPGRASSASVYIWGAYFAGYGFNAVVPARGGDVVRLFLTKSAVPGSSYPAVAASFFVEAGFDLAMGSLILLFAFSQGVFPKPPDFAKLNAFDLSYLAAAPALRALPAHGGWRWGRWWRSRC